MSGAKIAEGGVDTSDPQTELPTQMAEELPRSPEGGVHAPGGPDSQVSEEGKQAATQERRTMYDLEPSEDSAFRMDQTIVDPSVVQHLSHGFLQRFLPGLEKSKTSIADILNNQTVVIETLEQENGKFKDCTAHLDLSDMMVKVKLYHGKLLTIKRDMTALHDKAVKLKRRALKLQQQKQKEELQRAHQEERQLEKEQMLTARVASPEK